MIDLIWLSEAQIRLIKSCSPLLHGVPRVDDHWITSGFIFVITNGLRWHDAPAQYWPPKMIYDRCIPLKKNRKVPVLHDAALYPAAPHNRKHVRQTHGLAPHLYLL